MTKKEIFIIVEAMITAVKKRSNLLEHTEKCPQAGRHFMQKADEGSFGAGELKDR